MPVNDPLHDLDACAREPIHIPGGIQPHGALVVLEPRSFAPLQASANFRELTGLTPGELLGPAGAALIRELQLWSPVDGAAFLRSVEIGGRPWQVSAAYGGQGLLVELEAPPSSRGETLEALYPRIARTLEAVGAAESVAEISEIAVRAVRELTGFNRVLLYRFDAGGDGVVLAEDGDDRLPSYLGLRFPASDVPAQARELYRLNRLRLIPDADYAASPIEPASSPVDGQPLDLSLAALRSVSPIHLQYMRNMGTRASMSISVLVDGGLWGLISCHDAGPRFVNPQVRTACDILGQIVSLQIGSRERSDRARRRVDLKSVEARLLARISREGDFRVGLSADAADWMALADADGAALATPEGVARVGRTPTEAQIAGLLQRLREHGETVFATDSLAAAWPECADFADVASGLLAVSISQIHPSYLLWFREEVVRTVSWSGDPRKADDAAAQLHPRASFETWKELVRQRSRPFEAAEIEEAAEFRSAVVNIVLRQAEEKAALSDQLTRSNAELEAFSYSVSHDLRAPFRHIVGYAELLMSREKGLDEKSTHYVRSITEAALAAGRLVDDLLNFSHAGRSSLAVTRVDMNKLLEEVRRAFEPELQDRRVDWRLSPLPAARGDAGLLRQALANLVGNAIKYTQGRDPAVISVSGRLEGERALYVVEDNGVGFDPRYVGKLFGVFQRLHRADEFPGTGIGLALTKRILDRHGGSIEAEGRLDSGARFTFALPTAEPN